MPDRVHLIWTMAATFAAMGGLAGNEVRTSGTRPARSAILGLVGSAMGRTRDEDFSDIDALEIAVGTFSAGFPMRDYHTVQTVVTEAKKPAPSTRARALQEGKVETKITLRDYFTSVIFGVAARGDRQILERVEEALREPKWPLYFGRKSCMFSRPLNPRMVDAASFEEALRDSGPLDLEGLELREIAMTDGLDGGTPAYTEIAHDIPMDRQAYHFGTRKVAIIRPMQGDMQ